MHRIFLSQLPEDVRVQVTALDADTLPAVAWPQNGDRHQSMRPPDPWGRNHHHTTLRKPTFAGIMPVWPQGS